MDYAIPKDLTGHDQGKISEIVKSNKKTPKEFKIIMADKDINILNMSMDEYKKQVVASYTEYVLGS